MTDIRAVALDVDGVLTDGTVWWGPGDGEWKRFSFRDIMGVSRARRAGVVFALISGEQSALVDRYAEKMEVRFVYKGRRDKAGAVREFAADAGVGLDQMAFVGDDVNDLPAMALTGMAACPADAHPAVKAIVGFVAEATGGRGAVREFLDHLLAAREATDEGRTR